MKDKKVPFTCNQSEMTLSAIDKEMLVFTKEFAQVFPTGCKIAEGVLASLVKNTLERTQARVTKERDTYCAYRGKTLRAGVAIRLTTLLTESDSYEYLVEDIEELIKYYE